MEFWGINVEDEEDAETARDQVYQIIDRHLSAWDLPDHNILKVEVEETS